MRTSSAYAVSPRTISPRRSAYRLTNFGWAPPWIPSRSWRTSTWPSVLAPGADPDDRDLHVAHEHVGDVGGDRLEDDREAARLLERERLVEHGLRALGRAALGAVAAERRGGLRREPDVAHHRDAGAHDRAGALRRALELDRVAARLLDEAVRGLDRLLVGRLVGAEGQVADQQRRAQAAADRGGEHQQLVDGHRHGVRVAEHVVGGAVADQDDVDAGGLDGLGARVVVGGDHDDRLAQRAHLGELGERDRGAVRRPAAARDGEGWTSAAPLLG